MPTPQEVQAGLAAFLNPGNIPLEPALVLISPTPTVTPVTCGSNVQVYATVSPDSGKAMMGPPMCQLFVGNTVTASTPMSLFIANIWVAHFSMTNPYPEAAKVTATFVDYGTYITSTESDVALFPAPPQVAAATRLDSRQRAQSAAKSTNDFTGTCIKNDDDTTTVSAETTGAETAPPRAFLFYLGEEESHYDGLLAKVSEHTYSAKFPVTADFVNIKVRFGSQTKEQRADCKACLGEKR